MKIFRKFAVVLLAATAVGLFAGCANPANPPKKIDFPEKDEWTSINTDAAAEAFLKGAKGSRYKATTTFQAQGGIKFFNAMKVSDDGTKFYKGFVLDFSEFPNIDLMWSELKVTQKALGYEVLDDSKHTLITDSNSWSDYTLLLPASNYCHNQNYTRIKYDATSDGYILEKF